MTPKPLSFFTPESVFVDKAGMDGLLLTLRRDLRNDFYAPSPTNLAHEYISSDLAVAAETAAATTQNFDRQVVPTGTGSSDFFRSWTQAFQAIKNANIVISRIDIPDWDADNDKNEVLAEGFFHRAYWYYRLVHQFGDVPFINKEHVAPKMDFYTHSRKTILAKIQADMEFAVQWLPEIVEPGKVNRAAGLHLLTKICLANSAFVQAIDAASAVINNGRYKLMTQRFGIVAGDSRFNVIWDLHQKENKSLSNNTEAILVVQDKYGFPGSTNGTQTLRQYTPWWSNNTYLKDPDGRRACIDTRGNWQVLAFGRGVGQLRPSNYYQYTIWKDISDLRHDTDTNWMPVSKIRYNNPASKYYGQVLDIRYSNPQDTFRAYYGWPHYKLYVSDERVPDQPIGGNADWYVFRLAETYLLRAEAYHWVGENQKAAEDINKVRQRAKASPVSPSEISIAYILDERARELYAEEPRKTELTRISFIMADNNRNGYAIGNFSTKNFWYDRVLATNFYNTGLQWGLNEYKMSPFHVLWPVPQNAIDSNTGGRINQNAGYPGTEKNVLPLTEITDQQ
ncbi:RagB/SusD family nutrient uptake outer membrane protein [Parapedobacter sp. 2B3]|uniref:RagB/SusD family nutrient uptake outer membrane protein n=1 Tax=Parapedobacter sp. 2B3 TaxID=3342381 RepID=UPI0035B5E970